jgi:hypothetical protein
MSRVVQVNGYFPEGAGGKPWADANSQAAMQFWNASEEWLPTWQGADSALQVRHT